MGKIKRHCSANKWVGFTLAALLYTLWFVVWTGNLWLLLGCWSSSTSTSRSSSTATSGATTCECASAARPTNRLRMGQRHHLRNGRGVAGAHLHLPDVRHPHLVDGVVAAYRRLPLREQGGLRPADAQHAAVVPLRTPHDALLADEEIVLRGDQVAVPPAQGIAQRSSATTWWSSTSRRATRCCSRTRT